MAQNADSVPDRADYIAEVIMRSPSDDPYFLGGWIDAALDDHEGTLHFWRENGSGLCSTCGHARGTPHLIGHPDAEQNDGSVP